MVRAIPNVLTICNLITGFIGILLMTQILELPSFFLFSPQLNMLLYAFICVCVSGIFDLFDGWVARLLMVDGELGKQLDSLADLVSFGVLPAIFLYKWLILNGYSSTYILISIVYVVCSAYRLAKFNIDDRQSKIFLGLPTPAAAIFITSLIFWEQLINQHPYLLVFYGLFVSVMMVSKIPIISFKSLSNSLYAKFIFAVLGLIGLLALFFLGLKTISLTMHLYVFISIIYYILKK